MWFRGSLALWLPLHMNDALVTGPRNDFLGFFCDVFIFGPPAIPPLRALWRGAKKQESYPMIPGMPPRPLGSGEKPIPLALA